MRWANNPPATQGQERSRSAFLLLPICADGKEWRWMQFARWGEVLVGKRWKLNGWRP